MSSGGGGAAADNVAGGACSAAEESFLLPQIEKAVGFAVAPLSAADRLYRMSESGNSTFKFHETVDNKENVLIIIHATSAGGVKCVFGGFTTVGWGLPGRTYATKFDDKAFLFTLRNPLDLPPTAYPVKNAASAIYQEDRMGPVFGISAPDIMIGYHYDMDAKEGLCIKFPCHYEDTTGLGEATFTGDSSDWKLDDVFAFKMRKAEPVETAAETAAATDAACADAEAAFLQAEIGKVLGRTVGPILESGFLYRMKEHGKSTYTFHEKVDNKENVLIVIHATSADGTKCVFGGFTSVGWGLPGRTYATKSDGKAFIFTLRNPLDVPPTAYPVKNAASAIYQEDRMGPVFGISAPDIMIGYHYDMDAKEGLCIKFPCHYEDTTGLGEATFTGDSSDWILDDVWAIKISTT